MTRARILARRAIVALAILFVGMLAALYRRPGTPPEPVGKSQVAGTLAAESAGVRDQMRFQGFDYLETREKEGRYHLRATEALGFEENGEQIFRLKDVLFESEEGAPGRRSALTAPRAEFARISRAIRVFEGVRIEGEETTLRGASFHYEPLPRTFRSDGPVFAVRGSLVGTADGGALESRDGAVTLDGNVRMRGRADGRALDLAAPRVRLLRDGEMAAEGGVVAKSDGVLLRGERLLRTPDGAGERLQSTGGAHLLLAARPPRLSTPVMADAASIELQLSADGAPRYLELRHDGGLVRLLTPPDAKAGARKALSERFVARFAEDGRLAELTAPGKVEGFETAASGVQHLTAGFARLTFLAGDGGLDVAAFGDGVHLVDGARADLTAAEGTLRGPDQMAVFVGRPGGPAVYRDDRGTVRARTLSYSRRDERVDAVGEAVADYRPGSPAGGGQATSFFGGAPAEPIHSRSESLELRLAARTLTLRGKVQAWQKENVLRCRTLFVDDAARSLRAEGEVRAFLRKKVAKPAGPPGPPPAAAPHADGPDTINASGDVLTHREAEKLVRIEGHATIVSGSWIMTSDVTDIRLGAEQQVEFAEAKGSVVLEDRALHRRGEGAHATWRPVADVVTLEGSPAAVIDEKGNRLTGGTLTIRQGRSQVDVQPATGVPGEGVFRPEGS